MDKIAAIREVVDDTKQMKGQQVVYLAVSDVEFLLSELERLQYAQQEINRLKMACKQAHDIMRFHTMRCPLDIMNNFSGFEEHLAEYRGVMNILKEIGDVPSLARLDVHKGGESYTN